MNASHTPPELPPLSGYELLVCVTGGIAAYKTATLVSRLVQEGAGVTVAMTRHARRFIAPLTFQALSGRPVLISQWHSPAGQNSSNRSRGRNSGRGDDSRDASDPDSSIAANPATNDAADPGAMNHLRPSERADLLVVAPATANILGKLAHGIADDLVSTLLLGAACPVLLAPAMNTRMWQHPSVQRNIAFLRDHAFTLVGPEDGWLACRDTGPGRMSEPETILAAIRTELQKHAPRNQHKP